MWWPEKEAVLTLTHVTGGEKHQQGPNCHNGARGVLPRKVDTEGRVAFGERSSASSPVRTREADQK